MDIITTIPEEGDIDNGAPSASHHCPVALALTRRYPKRRFGNMYATVGTDRCTIRFGTLNEPARIRFWLPTRIREAILKLDSGGGMKPTWFKIKHIASKNPEYERLEKIT